MKQAQQEKLLRSRYKLILFQLIIFYFSFICFRYIAQICENNKSKVTKDCMHNRTLSKLTTKSYYKGRARSQQRSVIWEVKCPVKMIH